MAASLMAHNQIWWSYVSSDVAYCCIELEMLPNAVLLPAAVCHSGVLKCLLLYCFGGLQERGFLLNCVGSSFGRTCLQIGFFIAQELINFAPKDKFEIGDNYEDNALSQEVVEKKCNVLHKDWKCRMKKKWEKLVDAGTNPYAQPYKGIKLDDWKNLIDEVWLDPANKPRYDASKNNRSKLPYNHTSGSRSFPAAMSIAVKANSGLLPDLSRDEQLKRLTSELEILCAEQQSNREEQQKKEEEQQMKEADNTRQREEMQRQLFGLQSMLAQVLENRNPPNSRQ
ncbi:hypothetical protein ACSBR2_026624 [Camellia fascicularis]